MLDEKIASLARKTAAPTLKDLDEPLARSIQAIKRKLHAFGHMYAVIMGRYAQEMAQRADIIWRNLHRAHQSHGAPHSENLRNDLREALRVDLDAMMTVLSPLFETDMKGAPQSAKERSWMNKFGDVRDHELARHEAEIDHYVTTLETARARGTQSSAAYIVHGNVGAIVSGTGATATVVQNINPDQGDALVKALEAVKEAISGAPELIDTDRQELLELADEAAAEVSKEKPNGRRLAVILQSLAAAVQGIASGPAAYEVLRSAARAIGLPV